MKPAPRFIRIEDAAERYGLDINLLKWLASSVIRSLGTVSEYGSETWLRSEEVEAYAAGGIEALYELRGITPPTLGGES